jgi:hypothetical protein
MSKSQFFKSYIFCLLILCVSLVLLHRLPAMQSYIDLSFIGIIFFSLLSILVYFYGERLGRDKNRNLFSHLIIYNLMFKIFISFVILILYFKFAAPENEYFIVPFAFIYIAFTIFETYFLSYQARLSNSKNSKSYD